MNSNILVEFDGHWPNKCSNGTLTIKVDGEPIYISPEGCFYAHCGEIGMHDEELAQLKAFLNTRNDSIEIWEAFVHEMGTLVCCGGCR